MAVDVHVHIGSFPSVESVGHLLRSRPDVAAFRTRHPDLYRRFATETPVDNSQRLVDVMDEHGVERTLVQPRPGVGNDFVAQLAARHPDRLVPLALPTPWPTPADAQVGPDELAARPAEAAATLRRCMDELGMRAMGEVYVRHLTDEIHPERIADALSPMLEILAPRSLPLELPTAWTQFPGGLYYGDPLWVDELAARYPSVPIVLTKMGRGLTRYFESCLVVAVRNANVYFDTSDTTPEHLRHALGVVGPERVMFGTDWSATWQFMEQPASVHEIARRTIDQATDDPGVQAQILTKTAEHVFAESGVGVGMTPELTAAHWLYLTGVVVVVVTMGFRKNPIVPAVLFTGVVAWAYSGSVVRGVGAIFTGVLTAATDLFSIVLIIALITAMLAVLRKLGADTLMVRPLQGVMRSGHVAFFVLAAATYVLSLFFWPTPAVPLIAAVLMPVAVQAGLSPMGVAVAVGLAGQGMALSSDFVIRVAPSLSAKASGADAEAIANRSLVLSLVVGVVALTLAYLYERRSIRVPSPDHVVAWQGAAPAADDGKRTTGRAAVVMAIAVPAAYLLLVTGMIVSKVSDGVRDVEGSEAAALVGGIAVVLCVAGAVLAGRRQALTLVADSVTSGFTWAMKVMAIVFPIAGFFFLGNPAYAGAIMGMPEGTEAPGFLFDLVNAGKSVLPQHELVLGFGVLFAGMIGGLDGAGFSVLPLTGSIAGSLGGVGTADPATLAAIGQMGAIWVGGGTLAAWSSIIAVAGFARVDVVELTRRCFIPVVSGLVIATVVGVLLF